MSVGLLAGMLAALIALALLWKAGATAAMSRSAAQPQWLVAGAYAAYMAGAGALYGRVFMRAANDVRGGWLFGMSYGFLLWMLGPVTAVQWLSGQPPVVGGAARVLFAAHLVYGVLLGGLFPHAHRLVQHRANRVSDRT